MDRARARRERRGVRVHVGDRGDVAPHVVGAADGAVIARERCRELPELLLQLRLVGNAAAAARHRRVGRLDPRVNDGSRAVAVLHERAGVLAVLVGAELV